METTARRKPQKQFAYICREPVRARRDSAEIRPHACRQTLNAKPKARAGKLLTEEEVETLRLTLEETEKGHKEVLSHVADHYGTQERILRVFGSFKTLHGYHMKVGHYQMERAFLFWKTI